MSETSSCREALAPFCVGNGLDVGSGGDPIVPAAICIDRAEGDGRRAYVGLHPIHLVGDAADLGWFRDNTLDYVYSSHVLEDFEDTAAVLREWLRVLKPGGVLILFLPDQPTYQAYCDSRGELSNQAHKHANFSLDYVRGCLPETQEVFSAWPVPYNPYSFALVVRKP